MKVRVKVLAWKVRETSIDLDGGSTYGDILTLLEFNPEIVIVLVDGRPVPVDDIVDPHRLEILRVVSGGA